MGRIFTTKTLKNVFDQIFNKQIIIITIFIINKHHINNILILECFTNSGEISINKMMSTVDGTLYAMKVARMV